jgi:hypothetical protein
VADLTFSLAALHDMQAVRDPLMMSVVVTFTRNYHFPKQMKMSIQEFEISGQLHVVSVQTANPSQA